MCENCQLYIPRCMTDLDHLFEIHIVVIEADICDTGLHSIPSFERRDRTPTVWEPFVAS